MNKKKYRISNLIIYLFLILAALFVIAPLVLMVITALKNNLEFMKKPLSLPSKLNFDGFVKVFTEYNFLNYLWNSVFVTVISLAISLTISVTLSYALSRYKGKWINRLYFYFLVGMIIPIRLGVLFLNDMLNALGMLNNLWGLICIYTAMSIPFSMYIMSGYVRMIPRELDEAAIIDGCGIPRILAQVILPLIRPAIATVAIYNFMPIWNDVYFPLVFIFDESKKTFMLHVTMFFGQYSKDYNLIFSALTFAAAVSLIFYAFGSRQLVKGLTAGAVKG